MQGAGGTLGLKESLHLWRKQPPEAEGLLARYTRIIMLWLTGDRPAWLVRSILGRAISLACDAHSAVEQQHKPPERACKIQDVVRCPGKTTLGVDMPQASSDLASFDKCALQ